MSIQWKDSAPLQITCPSCSGRFTVPFGDLRHNRPVSCPHCELAIDASTFEADLRRLEEEMKRRFK